MTLQLNWAGRGTVEEGAYHLPTEEHSTQVQSFVIDDEERNIVILFTSGRLVVYAMEDYHQLSCLGALVSNPYSFKLCLIAFYSSPFQERLCPLTLSNGFLVFATKGTVEVWRRSSDVARVGNVVRTPLQSPSPLAVNDLQLQRASTSGQASHTSLRGQYTPHACIRSASLHSTLVRIFRVHYPLVAITVHTDRDAVFCYDIARGIQLQTITLDNIREAGKQSSPRWDLPNTLVLMDVQVFDGRVILCYESVIIIVTTQESNNDSPLNVVLITEQEMPTVLKDTALQLQAVDTPALGPTLGTSNWKTEGLVSSAVVPGNSAMERLKVVAPGPEALSVASSALVLHGAPSVRPAACFVGGKPLDI